MGNDFFKDHKHLGAMFDYDRDGSVNMAEAGAMAGFAGMAAREFERANRDAEREYDKLGKPTKGKNHKKRKKDPLYDLYEREHDIFDIDPAKHGKVMKAVNSGKYAPEDLIDLINESLLLGVEFDEDDFDDIESVIDDEEFLEHLLTEIDV